MSYIKQNLAVDTRVEFHATGGVLDGQTGQIMAKLHSYLTDDYIVAYDIMPLHGDKAIVITEACLRPI